MITKKKQGFVLEKIPLIRYGEQHVVVEKKQNFLLQRVKVKICRSEM